MSQLGFTIPHNSSKEKALEKARVLALELEEYSLLSEVYSERNPDGYAFRALFDGEYPISGAIAVGDTFMSVSVDLSKLPFPIRNGVANSIEKRLSKHFDRNEPENWQEKDDGATEWLIGAAAFTLFPFFFF